MANKEKDDEKKGGGIPLWSGGKKKPGLPSFRGSKASPGGSIGKKGGGIPMWPSQRPDGVAGMPMFRTRGLAGKAGLVGRLKGLKTKDLAFITAGLAVLVMAPIAEFLISTPEEEAGTLQQGFDNKGGVFGAGSPFEDGIAGIAPGGLPGQTAEVITPLNVRDPSQLVMGPGGLAKKPSMSAKTPPPKKRGGWRDAINEAKNAAKRGAKSAARQVQKGWKPSSKLPGKLRGLAGVSGNTGNRITLAKPSSQGLFTKPKAGSNLTRLSGQNYRGGDRRAIATGGAAPDGRFFDGRTTSPGAATAGEMLPSGYGSDVSGYGRGGSSGGEADKGPGGSSAKDSRNIGNNREDLAFLRRKLEMQKAIDLKWAKKRYNELERKKMIEQTLLQTAQQAFLKVLDKLLEGPKDGGGSSSSGSGSPQGGSPQGPAGDGQNKPRTPGNTPRPLKTDADKVKTWLAKLGQVQGKQKEEPPTKGGKVNPLTGVPDRSGDIDTADQTLGRGVERLGEVEEVEADSVGKYPDVSSGKPDVQAKIAAQKAEFQAQVTKAETALGLAEDQNKALRESHERLTRLKDQEKEAATQANKSVQDAKKASDTAKESTKTADDKIGEVKPAKEAYENAPDDPAAEKQKLRMEWEAAKTAAKAAIGKAKADKKAADTALRTARQNIKTAKSIAQQIKDEAKGIQRASRRYMQALKQAKDARDGLVRAASKLNTVDEHDKLPKAWAIGDGTGGAAKVIRQNIDAHRPSFEASMQSWPVIRSAGVQYGDGLFK